MIRNRFGLYLTSLSDTIGSRPLAGRRVAVVASDRVFRNHLGEALAGLGATAVGFSDALLALRAWDAGGDGRPEAFDVLVCGHAAPRLSGPALLMALRVGGFNGPAIGLADAGSEASAWLGRGGDALLSATLPVEDLARRVADVCRSVRA